jgi:hypothetical protein
METYYKSVGMKWGDRKIMEEYKKISNWDF